MADKEQSRTKTRKINLNDKADLDMILTELAVVDVTGALRRTLRDLVTAQAVRNHMQGKVFKEGDAVPIPDMFILAVRMWRKELLETVEKVDNFIQILEEGV